MRDHFRPVRVGRKRQQLARQFIHSSPAIKNAPTTAPGYHLHCHELFLTVMSFLRSLRKPENQASLAKEYSCFFWLPQAKKITNRWNRSQRETGSKDLDGFERAMLDVCELSAKPCPQDGLCTRFVDPWRFSVNCCDVYAQRPHFLPRAVGSGERDHRMGAVNTAEPVEWEWTK